MTARGWFVTATDTGAGKTVVSTLLLRALAAHGLRAAGMKPVASGCYATAAGWRSEDAEALIAAANVSAPYEEVNPYALPAATAPHLAARAAGISIEPRMIQAAFRRLTARADAVVVEGVGGWLVPVDATHTMADVVSTLDLPVILVVNPKLGAINHALLTQAAIAARGCRLAAWVANCAEPDVPAGYVEALRERLRAPCLGMVMHDGAQASLATGLDLTVLLGQ